MFHYCVIIKKLYIIIHFFYFQIPDVKFYKYHESTNILALSLVWGSIFKFIAIDSILLNNKIDLFPYKIYLISFTFG